MRCWIAVFLAVTYLAQAHVPSPAQTGRDPAPAKYGWLASLAEAKTEAKKSGKPIMAVLRCEPCVECKAFDRQVVRLEKIKDVADKFVRVRLTSIDSLDLNLFDFDYDLTLFVFFLDAEEKVYARYGGRDAKDDDSYHSLGGLAYTMQSVLDMHTRDKKEFAPRTQDTPTFVKDIPGIRSRTCLHCHEVKEAINANLEKTGKWSRDLVWRYPLPENLGFKLEVDRGNVVKEVADPSPASKLGLKAGDVVQRLGGMPIHSFGDAQVALDRAPASGALAVTWRRGDKVLEDKLTLPDGWRKTDIYWRPSLRHLVPSARLYGADLTPEEKKALGLTAKQLAFRQGDPVTAPAKAAGIRPGDVIVGIDGERLEMNVDGFLEHIKHNYLIDDRVAIDVLRDGKPLKVTMTLKR